MSILDDIAEVWSNTIFFFVSFLLVRLTLNLLSYIGKYNTTNSYNGDISQTVSTLNSAILDGVNIIVNSVNPLPFTSINLNTAKLEFDFIAGIIFLISLGTAFFVYYLKKE